MFVLCFLFLRLSSFGTLSLLFSFLFVRLRHEVLMVFLLILGTSNSVYLVFFLGPSSRPLICSSSLHSFPQPPLFPILKPPSTPPSLFPSSILSSLTLPFLSFSSPPFSPALHPPPPTLHSAVSHEQVGASVHPSRPPAPRPSPVPLSPKSAELRRGYSGVVSILKYAECAP